MTSPRVRLLEDLLLLHRQSLKHQAGFLARDAPVPTGFLQQQLLMARFGKAAGSSLSTRGVTLLCWSSLWTGMQPSARTLKKMKLSQNQVKYMFLGQTMAARHP